MTEHEQTLIDNILDKFNFERVHKCMTLLEWHWARVEGVPTIRDMRMNVRKNFKRAVGECLNSEHAVSATGGFEYHVYRENITCKNRDVTELVLKFVLDGADSE